MGRAWRVRYRVPMQCPYGLPLVNPPPPPVQPHGIFQGGLPCGWLLVTPGQGGCVDRERYCLRGGDRRPVTCAECRGCAHRLTHGIESTVREVT
jgi:hypothetical protein